MAKAPQAEPGTICPFHKIDVSKCCHKCALYIQVRGKNPQTGQDIDNWLCAIAATPLMTIEAARQSRSTAAAVENLTHEIVRDGEKNRNILAAISDRSQQLRLQNGHANE